MVHTNFSKKPKRFCWKNRSEEFSAGKIASLGFFFRALRQAYLGSNSVSGLVVLNRIRCVEFCLLQTASSSSGGLLLLTHSYFPSP